MSSHGELSSDASALLQALYDATTEEDIADIHAVATSAGLEPRRVDRALQELEEDDLVRAAGLGGEYEVTVAGRRRVEGRDRPPVPVPLIQAGRDANVVTAGTSVQLATDESRPQALARSGLGALLRSPWVVTIVGGVIVALIVAALTTGGDEEDGGLPAGEVVTVYNRVTSGPRAMIEDEPLRLFNAPKLCRDEACLASETGYQTGNKLSGVVCQTAGERITNGNDDSRSDDRNPRLFNSRLWYGVATSGRLAYFSEVWAEKASRGGLGLPDCASVDAASAD